MALVVPFLTIMSTIRLDPAVKRKQSYPIPNYYCCGQIFVSIPIDSKFDFLSRIRSALDFETGRYLPGNNIYKLRYSKINIFVKLNFLSLHTNFVNYVVYVSELIFSKPFINKPHKVMKNNTKPMFSF